MMIVYSKAPDVDVYHYLSEVGLVDSLYKIIPIFDMCHDTKMMYKISSLESSDVVVLQHIRSLEYFKQYPDMIELVYIFERKYGEDIGEISHVHYPDTELRYAITNKLLY